MPWPATSKGVAGRFFADREDYDARAREQFERGSREADDDYGSANVTSHIAPSRMNATVTEGEDAVQVLHRGQACPTPPPGPGATPRSLTPMQTRVLRFVRAGLPNKEIASALGISEATVKIHMTALMRRLNVRNRTQVAVVASDYD